MTPEQEIKQAALQRGADQVGIASVARINEQAPPGHRPDDILIGAKSVIVFAGRTTPRGAWRSLDYRTHYNNRDFPRVRTGIAMAVAKFIESNYGHYSIGQVPPPIGFNPSLSFKLCAEMAGLGTRSMAAGILLNRELGLLNFSVCITTMPLVADQPAIDPVCPHSSCVDLWEKRGSVPCLDVCPECLSGALEGGRIKWMRYDRRICSTRAQNEGMGALQRIILEGANERNPQRRKTILLGSFSRAVMEAVSSGNVTGQCSECVRVCPIHRDAQRLTAKVPTAELLPRQTNE
jgi:epoxyqueuosine reductase QueG